jgi:MFS family permease
VTAAGPTADDFVPIRTKPHTVLLTILLLFVAQTMVPVLVALVGADTGLGPIAIGILVAIPLTVGLVADIPFAWASDRIGRRPMLMGSALAGVCGALTLAIGRGVPILIVGVSLWGLAFSMGSSPILALLSETTDQIGQARIQAINGAVQGVSAFLGAALAGAISARAGPYLGFLAAVALMVGVGALGSFIREPPRSVLQGKDFRLASALAPYLEVPRLLRTRPILLACAVGAALYTLQFVVVGNSFVPVFLVSTAGQSSADVGFLLAVRGLVAAGASLAFALLVRRLGVPTLMIGPTLIGMAGVVLVPVVAGTAFQPIAFALQGIGVGFAPATINVLIASTTATSERALAFSTSVLLGRGLALVAPLSLGAAASRLGYEVLFYVAALAGTSAVALMALLLRRFVGSDASNRQLPPPR